jgi:hypothetical protein
MLQGMVAPGCQIRREFQYVHVFIIVGTPPIFAGGE